MNIKQELNARREKFLLLILQNYATLQHVYPADKLMVLLREIAGNLELPVDQVVPSEHELQNNEGMQMEQMHQQIEANASNNTLNMLIKGGMAEEEVFEAFQRGQFSEQLNQQPQQVQ